MQQESSWPNWSTVLFLLIAVSLAAATVAVWSSPPAVEPAPHDVAPVTAAFAPATDPSDPPAPVRTAAEPAPTPPRLDFASCIDELCELGRRTAVLAEQDEIDAAKALDRKARELFAILLAAFPDAGDRSLAMMVDLAPTHDLATREQVGETADPTDHTRRIVLQTVLQTDLARRHELAAKIGDHRRIDALTLATLDTMPIHSVAADVGGTALADRPYLRLRHEPSVLELVRLAGQQSFPREIATRLLLTLWDNLQETGERTSTEMSQLALLLLDSDPSQAVAACRQLLADPRYRPLVLSWLRERRDQKLAAEIARLAARELPPRDALHVLRELTPLLTHARGAYLGLAIRAPDLLADAYCEHLAADNQPDVRRELVMAVGMLPQPVGLQIAELALADDPSPAVRIQAMYVYTVHGNGDQAERAIERLLDDPVINSDPVALGAIVLALPNLEQGDANVIARLGRRLQSLPLSAESRQQLAEVLARVLPGGAPAGEPPVREPGK